MNRLTTYLFVYTICTMLLATSCRKRYYNCECAYLNEYDEVDTMLISVRTTNREKAAKGCADKEVDITYDEGYFLYCNLQQ